MKRRITHSYRVETIADVTPERIERTSVEMALVAVELCEGRGAELHPKDLEAAGYFIRGALEPRGGPAARVFSPTPSSLT